MIKLTTF